MNEVKLLDGRTGYTMPWHANSPKPWRDGYSRLFIKFTDAEMRLNVGAKRGHIQIVRNSKFKAV